MPEFKLSGASSDSLPKPGQKTSYDVEGVEKAQVLIANVGGKLHATSPKCTHFGAPLANGVLHGERLTCPWHGACFNVVTGDVEDAPALDPLAKFEILEKNDGVYIVGDEDVVKSNFPKPFSIKCMAQGSEKVVVVGGGSGCLGAVEGLRSGGFNGHLTIISSEGYQPIDRTKLSKALLADVSKLAWRSKEWYKDSSVDLLEDEVTAVDFAGKKVTTKAGKTVEYTKLVLSTGGSPRWLPLPGLEGDLENVFVLRTIPHVQGILDSVGDNGKKVVVIGSSFIGMEVANCLAGKKNTVSVIGMESEPMERVMGKEVGTIFRGLLEKNGVKFYMNASVAKGSADPKAPENVGAVHLKDGTVIEADLVIEGVGVAPATGYLKKNSAIQLLKDGSLETDESFKVKGLTDVYAIGDIASYPYHGPGGNGQLVRIEHWNVAQKAGRIVAHDINKPGSKPDPFVPIFWSALGQQLRYCGNTMPGYDDVVIMGDTGPEKYGWAAYYTKGEEVVAVATMGKDPVMAQSAELMRLGKMLKKSDIKGGKDVLSV